MPCVLLGAIVWENGGFFYAHMTTTLSQLKRAVTLSVTALLILEEAVISLIAKG